MPVKYSAWLLIVVCLANTCIADEDDDASGNTGTQVTQQLITLDQTAQAMAGIRTWKADRFEYKPEFAAHGRVPDITPLLTLKARYLTSVAHAKTASARLMLSQSGMSRLQNLNKNDVISTRKLQEQLSQWQIDQAGVEEMDLQQQTLIATSRQRWGTTLTRWFTDTSSPEAQDIIQHKSQLLQISLPVDKNLPTDIAKIRISTDGDASHYLDVRMIERSPQADPMTQGQVYFLLALNSLLPTGLYVSVWIPSQSGHIEGVIIPHSALLWHMGQRFVYVRHGDEQFIRRLISGYYRIPEGYFITDAIHAGEEVVSTGAQQLYSQQLSARIPAEDDE